MIGALIGGVIFALVALVGYKLPTDWYMPFFRWWKSEEEAERIQQEAKWIFVLWFACLATLCIGLYLIAWYREM